MAYILSFKKDMPCFVFILLNFLIRIQNIANIHFLLFLLKSFNLIIELKMTLKPNLKMVLQ